MARTRDDNVMTRKRKSPIAVINANELRQTGRDNLVSALPKLGLCCAFGGFVNGADNCRRGVDLTPDDPTDAAWTVARHSPHCGWGHAADRNFPFGDVPSSGNSSKLITDLGFCISISTTPM